MQDWRGVCRERFLAISDDVSLTQDQKAARWSEAKLALEEQARATIPKLEHQRIVLTDLQLEGRDISGYNLSRTFFARVRFDRCRLVSTSFRQSIFDACSMAYADIQGADFWHADLTDMSMFNVTNYWLGANLDTSSGIDAARNHARVGLVEAALEQQRRADLQRAEPSWLLRWWDRKTNFGTDFRPLSILYGGGTSIFGGLYYAVQRFWPAAFSPLGDYTIFDTFAMALLRSITTSAIVEPATTWLAYLFFLNGFFGIVIISLFVAQITKIFVRS